MYRYILTRDPLTVFSGKTTAGWKITAGLLIDDDELFFLVGVSTVVKYLTDV